MEYTFIAILTLYNLWVAILIIYWLKIPGKRPDNTSGKPWRVAVVVPFRNERDQDILQSVLVGEVAQRTNLHTVPVDMTLSQLSLVFSESHHHGLPVLDDAGQLWGIVTVSDLEQALDAGLPSDTVVVEIGTSWPHLKVTFLDESIGEALARMGTRGLGRMPVVSREDPYDLLGMIRRQDIIRAYDLALTRRDETKDRTERIQQLQQEDGTEFVEIFLKAGDPVVGKSLQEVAPALPLDCVLISVERNGRVIIPHGDTIFRAGDHITAYTRHEDAAKLFDELHTT